MWGQWIQGERISGIFPLKYAGAPSRFEGRTVAPPGPIEAGLQVVAIDAAGNTGVHTLDFTVGP